MTQEVIGPLRIVCGAPEPDVLGLFEEIRTYTSIRNIRQNSGVCDENALAGFQRKLRRFERVFQAITEWSRSE